MYSYFYGQCFTLSKYVEILLSRELAIAACMPGRILCYWQHVATV